MQLGKKYMDSAPDISVIIVSYNVWGYLQPCLRSVFDQENVSVEVIVVDNNSTDNTVENIGKEFPSTKVISNSVNMGFSGANNQGINVAMGNYLLLLNPDTELRDGNILFQMKEFLCTSNQSGVIAPCLLNTDGSFQLSFWKTPGVLNLFLELFYLHKVNKQAKPEKPISVETASGAALFFSKKIIDKVGLLDENMFWMDDIDFCYRVLAAGQKIVYNPEIEIIHHGGKSSSNYAVVIPNQVISKIKFYKKHGPWIYYALMNMLSFAFIVSRWCMFTLLSITGKDTFIRKRKAYAVTFGKYITYNTTGDSSIIK